ncbi:hypothetical protein AGMMS49556_09070 [Endomicrobiia bacterium]|nr:hypothetical protein AGMMS49556_09070 [Endomicrobiia bacterium]
MEKIFETVILSASTGLCDLQAGVIKAGCIREFVGYLYQESIDLAPRLVFYLKDFPNELYQARADFSNVTTVLGKLENYIVASDIVQDTTDSSITYTGTLYKNGLLIISCYRDKIPADQLAVSSITFNFTNSFGSVFKFNTYTVQYSTDLKFTNETPQITDQLQTSVTYWYRKAGDIYAQLKS